jgi:DprA winged helix domain
MARGQSAEDRRARLMALLGPAPVNIDDLVRACSARPRRCARYSSKWKSLGDWPVMAAISSR